MLAVILTNLRRRSGRTALTAAGIAVGVATIVGLLALSAGLTRSAGELVHLGQADLGLFQANAADPTSSVLPLSLLARVRARPEVAEATPLQLVIGALDREPSAVVFGTDPHGFVARRLVFTAGRPAAAGETTVGDLLAGQLHVGVGNTIDLQRRAIRVAGIYHSGISFADSGAIMPLGAAQQLAGRSGDEATTIAVKLMPRISHDAADRALTRAFPGVRAISTPGDAVRAGANALLIDKAVVVIVVLALIVGALAVANTMLTAVLERQRELALLSTIGWSARQIAALVLGEAVVLSLVGVGFGLALGVALSGLLPGALGLSDVISADVTAWGLGRAILVGLAIGVLGAIYPSWRSTRLLPREVLAQI
ncbi:MAG: ABC transporter permease [Solirubrobacteraceae bacterium]